jgi:hypothetical protein
MRRLFLAALALLGAMDAQAEPGLTEWNIPPYRIVLKTDLDEAGPSDELTVYSDGAQIYRRADAFVRSELTLGQETIADDMHKPISGHDDERVPGNDVLGLGYPNLVFADYTGGMHCCFKAIVLMLGRPFRVQEIDLYDPGGNFHPAEGRKSLVLEGTDATFKEWRASPAESPFPTIMLSFDRAAGLYLPDAELMRAPLPAPDELAYQQDRALARHRQDLADGWADEEPGALTGPMLELIYTGHLKEAHTFLAGAWAGGAEAREAYWSLVTRCKLRTSPYWPAVAKINGLAADPPAADCPRR